MQKLAFAVAALVAMAFVVGCTPTEQVDMPKDDPVIGKPHTPSGENKDANPEKAGKDPAAGGLSK